MKSQLIKSFSKHDFPIKFEDLLVMRSLINHEFFPKKINIFDSDMRSYYSGPNEKKASRNKWNVIFT